MHYTATQVATISQQTFAQITVKESEHTLHISLNRPQAKNAMSPTMIREYAFALAYAHYSTHIWAVVFRAEGNVWCAGMDLKAMRGQEEATNSSIPMPTAEIVIGELIPKIHKPVIVLIDAPLYAGGLLLVATAHYVVGSVQATFALPEVKRGLFPFQVMALLLQNMPTRQVLDFCMRGRTLSAQEAHQAGLITHLVASEDLEQTLETLLNELFENSPAAIRIGLEAFEQMRNISNTERQLFLKQQFERTAQTEDAQEGMQAFIEKRKPQWKGI